MKQTLMTVMMLIFVSTASYGQTGAFANDCPTIEQQQAAYNQQKASSIAVVNTASQQLQCHYQQLATYYQQLHKTNQQLAKDQQQLAKDKQQIEAEARQLAKDKAQVAIDAAQKAKELELKAREAVLKDREEECNLMYIFFKEIKIMIEKPDCNEKEVVDHCRKNIRKD